MATRAPLLHSWCTAHQHHRAEGDTGCSASSLSPWLQRRPPHCQEPWLTMRACVRCCLLNYCTVLGAFAGPEHHPEGACRAGPRI